MRLSEIKATAIKARARQPRRPMPEAEPIGLHVWSGASGRTFVHTIYSLIGCPAPLAASYVLVHRSADGARRALAVDRTLGHVESLNLATIRERAAKLGANEVHLATGWNSESERAVAAFDIAAAHDGERAMASAPGALRH